MKPIIYEAKGLIKLPGRGLMTFAEYRKEFGRSPVTGEKLGVPLIAAHFEPLLSEEAITALEGQRILNLIRSKEIDVCCDIRIVDIDGLLQLVRLDFIPIFNHGLIIEELETI